MRSHRPLVGGQGVVCAESGAESAATTKVAPRSHGNTRRDHLRWPATGGIPRHYTETRMSRPPPHVHGKEEVESTKRHAPPRISLVPRVSLSMKTRFRGPLVAQTSIGRTAQPCGVEGTQRPKVPAKEAVRRRSSSGVVVPDSACHAGGRGSSPAAPVKVPANWHVVLTDRTRNRPDYTNARSSGVETPKKGAKPVQWSRFQAVFGRVDTNREGDVPTTQNDRRSRLYHASSPI